MPYLPTIPARLVTTLLLAGCLTNGLTACVPMAIGAAGSAALAGTDRRPAGAYVDDQSLEFRLGQQIGQRVPDAHININSYNRAVLLTGEVPDEAARQQVEFLAQAQPGVRKAFNHTVVAPNSSVGNRLNDSSLTTKVKARLVESSQISSNHVKVVSERGQVYLLGLLTEAEAAEASRIASQTAGVVRVVTLFEFLAPKSQ